MSAAGRLARQWPWLGAEPKTREADLAMGDQEQAPGITGENPGHGPDVLDEAREAALMRKVLRNQEQHREGGVESGLDQPGEDPRSGA
jgi:hypothetical protein